MDMFNLINQYNICITANNERLAKIDSFNSFAQKIKYCKSIFNQLASGSSRVVFEYDNDYVLKVAKNEKGIAQNKLENDGFIQQSDCVTKIIKEGNDNSWLLVQRAKKITPKMFEGLTGINFKLFGNYIDARVNFKKYYIAQMSKEELDKLSDNEFVNDVLDIMVNFDMPIGDIARISSWGEVGGKAVLTDYGLSKDIYNEYYKR